MQVNPGKLAGKYTSESYLNLQTLKQVLKVLYFFPHRDTELTSIIGLRGGPFATSNSNSTFRPKTYLQICKQVHYFPFVVSCTFKLDTREKCNIYYCI